MIRRVAALLLLPLLLLCGSAQAQVGVLPPYVTSTSPLSTTELSVARAYLALFGRAPEPGGLNHWSSLLGPNATLAQAVNRISDDMAGSLLAPIRSGQQEYVEYVYVNLLGKSADDDRNGVNYWASTGLIRGDLINAILNAALQTGDNVLVNNRLLVVEAAARLQKARGRSLDYQDSQTLVRRVTDSLAAYNDAMADLDRLTSGTPSTPNQWDQDYNWWRVHSESRALSGSSVRVHKYLVWYNRSGQMMLAHVFLPTYYYDYNVNYSTYRFPAIISVHGGGWREGFVEKLQQYNMLLAESLGAVVFAPAYRLTSYGYASPASQNDIEDFINLVKASGSRFTIDPARVGLFGESAGGHLVNLLGSTSNMRCVSTLYPVSNLASANVCNDGSQIGSSLASANGCANITPSTDLTPFVGYYAGSCGAGYSVSPTSAVRWTGTRFHIQHGCLDTLVHSSQTDEFAAAASARGVSVGVVKLSDKGHGFYNRYNPADQPTSSSPFVQNIVGFFNGCL